MGTIQSSQKKSSTASLFPRCKLATSLPSGSPEQIALVQSRIRAGVCFECGRPKEGCGNFCAACLAEFPKTIDVGDGGEMLALNAWRFAVIQTGPAIPGLGLFRAVKLGVFENAHRGPRLICLCDTLAEAAEAARRSWNRSPLGGW